MIGSIATKDGREAVLQDDGVWSSGSSTLELLLNTLHSPHKSLVPMPSREMPWWGRDQVQAAAKQYSGEATFPKYENEPDFSTAGTNA